MDPRLRPLLPALALLSLAGCGDSIAAPDVAVDPTPVGPVQAAVDSFRAAHPGVLSAIGLVRTQGGTLLGGSSGHRDQSRAAPVDLETPFTIGSATKTFTAVMVLQLVEEGEVELDAPVIRYLSEEWAAVLSAVTHGPDITVRQALSHRSGIFDYLTSPLQSQILSGLGRLVSPLEAFRYVSSGPPSFAPGTDFSYSNTNFLMLGHVVEHVTGLPYEGALQDRILSRIGLTRTFPYSGGGAATGRAIAHSYATIGGTRFDNLDLVSSGWSQGVGGLVSTAGDLVAFMRSLGTGALVEAHTLEIMTDLGQNTWYGLGVQIVDRPGLGRCFGHGGYAFGSTAHMYHCPDAGVTYSAFYGADGTRTLGAHLDIVDRIVRVLP